MKLADFYRENPDRRISGEADYGVWWIDGPPFPRYRVSYIQATGEVYAINHQTTEVEVLGVVPTDPPTADDLGSRSGHIYYQTLDGILDGWAEVEDHQLAWVRERLENLRLSVGPPILCRLCNRSPALKDDICDASAERVV